MRLTLKNNTRYNLFISDMDFIKKNKILAIMTAIAILSFILEKAGIIKP